MSAIYRERAQMYARADYYVWAARRRDAPTGNDPITGQPLISWKQFDRALGAASYAAMARVSYAAARSFPVPPALSA
jgi:hypothetical protein